MPIHSYLIEFGPRVEKQLAIIPKTIRNKIYDKSAFIVLDKQITE